MARRVVAWLGFCLSLAFPAFAQQPGMTATIRGRVLDPQQQGVAATVRAVSAQTGIQRETRSNASGTFTLAGLSPGPVELIVTAPGFADRHLEGLQLEVNQSIELEIALTISSVVEKVNVSASADRIDVLTSAVSGVVTAREIESPPLNGRNFMEIASLFVILGTFEQVMALLMCATLGFIVLIAAALLVVRRRADAGVVFNAPGLPATTVLFVLLTAGVVVLVAVSRPLQAIAGFALVLLGLPAYELTTRQWPFTGTAGTKPVVE